MNYFSLAKKEPYRLFFPVGIIYLLWGALVWLPQIWNPGDYPVLAHRYLMLNGFVSSFIAGFLMTAVPKFSKSFGARLFEILPFFLITMLGVFFSYQNQEQLVSVISSCQALIILFFLFTRIFKRQENPPYSFIFIFVGLILWLVAAMSGIFVDSEVMERVHYEGAIAAIILGVGSRLIPGILGHVEIVSAQRKMYERPVSLLATVPPIFFLLIFSFVLSYLAPDQWGSLVRAIVVMTIGMKYWLLWKAPKEQTTFTWSLWLAGWLFMMSFVLRASWQEGSIHAGHSFFITGIVLFCLLIGTRVLQSHGPKVKALENSKILYGVSLLIILSAATRVTAVLVPEQYFKHLGFSALLLVCAVILWSFKYLRYVRTS